MSKLTTLTILKNSAALFTSFVSFSMSYNYGSDWIMNETKHLTVNSTSRLIYHTSRVFLEPFLFFFPTTCLLRNFFRQNNVGKIASKPRRWYFDKFIKLVIGRFLFFLFKVLAVFLALQTWAWRSLWPLRHWFVAKGFAKLSNLFRPSGYVGLRKASMHMSPIRGRKITAVK